MIHLEEYQAGRLDLIGGDLSLDFTNTVSNHETENPNEHLHSYVALLAWARHTGILTSAMALRLQRRAAREPAEAQSVLERAITLRESLYRLVLAAAAGEKAVPADLEVLNLNLAHALPHARVVYAPEGMTWAWEYSEDALDQVLWPVARSAANLLTSDRIGRVRECTGDTCGWLFVDASKNHSRRWCSMSDCGNRAKANRFYKRKHSAIKPIA
ncbi:MAG: CGNR zinc finger domain-containing protein [Acidobacteriota bacterium]